MKKEEKKPTATPTSKAAAKPAAKVATKPAAKAEAKPAAKPAAKAEEKKVQVGKYEVFPVGEKVFVYRLKANNGEIMVVSELYTTSKGAVAAIDTVKKNVENGLYYIYKDKHGLYQFKLYGQNKKLLCYSANYSNEKSCQAACESFRRFAAISPVVELKEDPNHLMEPISVDKVEDKKGGKIVVDKFVKDEEASFRLYANNKALLCTSMSYKTRAILLDTAKELKEAIRTGTFFVVKDKKDFYQFKLYSTTGRCIAIGESYDSKTKAKNAASSFCSFAKEAEIVEGE